MGSRQGDAKAFPDPGRFEIKEIVCDHGQRMQYPEPDQASGQGVDEQTSPDADGAFATEEKPPEEVPEPVVGEQFS